MFSMYMLATKEFSNRILLVRMEEFIVDTKTSCNKMCEFLNVKFVEEMLHPYKHMRHEGKRNRYKSIDSGQLALWKNWKEVYGGFFVKNSIDVESLFTEVKPLVEIFGYGKV